MLTDHIAFLKGVLAWQIEKWSFTHLSSIIMLQGLLWWLSGKEPACQYRRQGFDPWVQKIPWRRKWQPILVFLSGKCHGQRNLAGYNPWGSKRVERNLLNSNIMFQASC